MNDKPISPERRSEIASNAAKARWEAKPGLSNVYVMGSADGPQKIGIAKNLRARHGGIQVGNHLEIIVAHTVEVEDAIVKHVERQAHSILEEKRLRGEWFDVSPGEALDAILAARDAVWTCPPGEREGTMKRKIFDGPDEQWDLLEEYRARHGLRSWNEAIKHLILEDAKCHA